MVRWTAALGIGGTVLQLLALGFFLASGLPPNLGDPAKVLSDVTQGYVSPQRAERDYGVAVVKKGRVWEIDAETTARLRAAALSAKSAKREEKS